MQEELFQGFGDEADSAKRGKMQVRTHNVLDGEKGDEKKVKEDVQLVFDNIIEIPRYWPKPIAEDFNSETSSIASSIIEEDDFPRNEVSEISEPTFIKDDNSRIALIIATYPKWNPRVVRNNEVLDRYSELFNLEKLMAANNPTFPIDLTNIWSALIIADMCMNNERKLECLKFIKKNATAVLEDDDKIMFVTVGLQELFLEVKCYVLNKQWSSKYSLAEQVIINRSRPPQKGWTTPKLVYCIVSILTIVAVYVNGAAEENAMCI